MNVRAWPKAPFRTTPHPAEAPTRWRSCKPLPPFENVLCRQAFQYQICTLPAKPDVISSGLAVTDFLFQSGAFQKSVVHFPDCWSSSQARYLPTEVRLNLRESPTPPLPPTCVNSQHFTARVTSTSCALPTLGCVRALPLSTLPVSRSVLGVAFTGRCAGGVYYQGACTCPFP